MGTIVPDEGLEWYSEKGLDVNPNEVVWSVGVGDGTTSVSSSDTQLDNELYRGTDDSNDNSVSIFTTSNLGQVQAEITVNGGTEVPADSDLTEFAIWAGDPNDFPDNSPSNGGDDSKDTMIYREVRTAVTIASGDQKTFTIKYDIKDN